jgi:hypothetical protein
MGGAESSLSTDRGRVSPTNRGLRRAFLLSPLLLLPRLELLLFLRVLLQQLLGLLLMPQFQLLLPRLIGL